ncbi:metalloprotease ATP23 [Russula vinacea]|nr:metalloprotease ATP23 [Russula vinacea]
MNAPGQPNPAEPPLLPHQLPPSENKLFRKWRREFSLITGYGIDSAERVFTINRRNCERWKKELLNYSPSVQFMLKHLKLAGVNCDSAHMPCLPCDLTRSGGFSPEAGAVVLCQGNFLNKKHMEHTLVHELVHMYDHATFNVNWNSLRHHACSEIRANSLSGDCSWGREIQRGTFSFSKQHQACVRRRAVLSVMANPNCKDKESAERAVNEVWESCFNDTRPFDEIY